MKLNSTLYLALSASFILTMGILAGSVGLYAKGFSSVAQAIPPPKDGQGNHISSNPDEISSPTTYPGSFSLFSDDPMIDKQWALDRTGLTRCDLPESKEKTIVAILDTGIDATHEDLNGKVIAEINFTESSSTFDRNGHGTHIAGIIAANRNNGVGISGIAPDVLLMNVKVADDFGLCKTENVVRGILWAVDHGAGIINVSLEIKTRSTELENAVDYAWNQGVIVIAAAGNSASSNPVFPAFYANSIAVNAVDKDNGLAPLSNYGDWVDVAAPGSGIFSTLPGNKYDYETGTSFAAAQVSGLAALLLNVVSDLDADGRVNDEVRELIEAGCIKLAEPGTGSGLIDVAASLSAAGSSCH